MIEILCFAAGFVAASAVGYFGYYAPLRVAYDDLDGAHRRLTDRDARGRFTRREV